MAYEDFCMAATFPYYIYGGLELEFYPSCHVLLVDSSFHIDVNITASRNWYHPQQFSTLINKWVHDSWEYPNLEHIERMHADYANLEKQIIRNLV